jgi:N-acetylmuramoyl-L-alanine amidase
MRKETKYIIIHCTATRPSMDIGFEEIDKWHRTRGFFSCGYHKIIRRDGTIEQGRADEEAGAHCRGRNHDSISCAMVGGVSENNVEQWEDNFEGSQWTALKELIIQLHNKYPEAEICGHYKFSDTKKCPSFDVEEWKKIELDWIEGDLLPDDERD